MTYRGLDPRTARLRWGLGAVGVGLVVGWLLPLAVRGVLAVIELNPASLPWLFERLFAWLAYLALTGSVVYGLLLSTRILDAIAHRTISFALHQDLASIGVGLAGVHGFLLVLDSKVPFSVAQVLVPGLAPHAPLGVALGQISLYLSLVVVGSFYVRRRIGQKTWRRLHHATFLAFVGATLHGVLAGTDSGTPWARWVYLGATAAVTFLVVYRVGMSIVGQADQRATAGAPVRRNLAHVPGSPHVPREAAVRPQAVAAPPGQRSRA